MYEQRGGWGYFPTRKNRASKVCESCDHLNNSTCLNNALALKKVSKFKREMDSGLLVPRNRNDGIIDMFKLLTVILKPLHPV